MLVHTVTCQPELQRVRAYKMKKTLLLAPILLSVVGCTDHLEETRSQLATIKQQAVGVIEAAPKLDETKPVKYTGEGNRNPFLTLQDYLKVKDYKPRRIHLDPNRNKSYLEQFSIEELRIQGVFSKNGKMDALLKTPNGDTVIVSVGDFIGLDNGRIASITKDEINVIEAISDGSGTYLERPRSFSAVAVSES